MIVCLKPPMKSSLRLINFGFVPRSEVFVEGLALLRLAERLGFELRDDYPMCPGIARLRPGKPFPDDMFPEIEAARGQS